MKRYECPSPAEMVEIDGSPERIEKYGNWVTFEQANSRIRLLESLLREALPVVREMAEWDMPENPDYVLAHTIERALRPDE